MFVGKVRLCKTTGVFKLYISLSSHRVVLLWLGSEKCHVLSWNTCFGRHKLSCKMSWGVLYKISSSVRLGGPSTSDVSIKSWPCDEGDVLEQVEMSVWYVVSYQTCLNVSVVCRDVNCELVILLTELIIHKVLFEFIQSCRHEHFSVCRQHSPLMWSSKVSLRACRAAVPCSRTLYKVDQLTQRWFVFTHEAILLLLSAFVSVSAQMQLKCLLNYL